MRQTKAKKKETVTDVTVDIACEENTCKVVIPGGTERSYGIRWRSETRVMDEAKGDRMDGWTDGRTE